MKIAITGHTSGIGRALARQYEQRGHTIVGLSKREGNDIRDINQIADKIESCDMFINNAQQAYAQTELLFEIHRRWKDLPGKEIINIGTMMFFKSPIIEEKWSQYHAQKVALTQASINLALSSIWPKILVIHPGEITAEHADNFAKSCINIIESVTPEMRVYEFCLGMDYE